MWLSEAGLGYNLSSIHRAIVSVDQFIAVCKPTLNTHTHTHTHTHEPNSSIADKRTTLLIYGMAYLSKEFSLAVRLVVAFVNGHF